MGKKINIKDLVDLKQIALDWGMSIQTLNDMSKKKFMYLFQLKEVENVYNKYKLQAFHSKFDDEEEDDEVEKSWLELKGLERDVLNNVQSSCKKFANFLWNLKQVRSHIESFDNAAHGFIVSNFVISSTHELYDKMLFSQDYPDKKILTIILYWMHGHVYYYMNVWGDDLYKHLPLRNNKLYCDENGEKSFILGTYPFIQLEAGKELQVLRIQVLPKEQYVNNLFKYPEGFPDSVDQVSIN